ncbi:MAG: flagellar basal-body rod protein FlgF [Syntrophales bacterium]|nr:flagellar basal-body rod protein FlgF [Syntrophales bacterium]
MGFGIGETGEVMGRLIQKLEHASANLANTSTAGYKAVHLYAVSKQANLGEAINQEFIPVVDFSPGLTQRTGNELDLMIEGEGFFVVQAKDGIFYTRRGDFTLDREGRLVTQTGDLVLGEGNRPIVIKGGPVSISEDGQVKAGAEEVGRLRIVTFDQKQGLERKANGYFASAVEGKKVDKPKVVQGAIESSNVNPIREMVDLIDIQRSFEVYQKVIQTISEEERTATSRVGRLA